MNTRANDASNERTLRVGMKRLLPFTLLLVASCSRSTPAPADTAPTTNAATSASAKASAEAPESEAPVESGADAAPETAPSPTTLFGPEVTAIFERANAKMNAGDGKGCLAELDTYDATGPQHPSTDPRSSFAYLRGQCLMLSGKCQAGKELLRKTYGSTHAIAMGGPEQVERSVDAMVMIYCVGGDATPRDQLLRALYALQQGAYITKKDAAFCKKAHDDVKRLAKTVKPRDDEDTQVEDGTKVVYFTAAQCFARAGDCDQAWKAYQDGYPMETLDAIKDPKMKADVLRQGFESSVEKCKPASK